MRTITVAAIGALLLLALVVLLLPSGETRPALAAPVRDATDVYTAYLPLVANRYSLPISFTAPAVEGHWIVGAGYSLQEALSGNNLTWWRYDRGVGTMNGPLKPGKLYRISRPVILFNLSGAPQGEILSATLELGTYSYVAITADFLLQVYQDNCPLPVRKSHWSCWEEPPLGTYDTSQWTPGNLQVWIPLPGLVGQPVPDRLAILLRGDEVTELPYGAPDIYASFDLLWTDDWDDWDPCYPVSFLHLVVGGGS